MKKTILAATAVALTWLAFAGTASADPRYGNAGYGGSNNGYRLNYGNVNYGGYNNGFQPGYGGGYSGYRSSYSTYSSSTYRSGYGGFQPNYNGGYNNGFQPGYGGYRCR